MAQTNVKTLDVRPIEPREKHPAIFTNFDSLAPGEVLQLINDTTPNRYITRCRQKEAGSLTGNILRKVL